VTDLKGWYLAEEALDNGAMSPSTLDTIIQSVTDSKTPKSVTFPQFAQVAELIDNALSLHEGIQSACCLLRSDLLL
jgi:hypothetical protein